MAPARVDQTSEVAIEVEFIQDPDSLTWVFRIPSLHVIGVAETENEALILAKESIIDALETQETSPEATKRGYFNARVSSPKSLVPA